MKLFLKLYLSVMAGMFSLLTTSAHAIESFPTESTFSAYEVYNASEDLIEYYVTANMADGIELVAFTIDFNIADQEDIITIDGSSIGWATWERDASGPPVSATSWFLSSEVATHSEMLIGFVGDAIGYSAADGAFAVFFSSLSEGVTMLDEALFSVIGSGISTASTFIPICKDTSTDALMACGSFAVAFGAPTGGGTTVSEPASMGLLLMGVMGVVVLRRRS